jgi:hypothetical protein
VDRLNVTSHWSVRLAGPQLKLAVSIKAILYQYHQMCRAPAGGGLTRRPRRLLLRIARRWEPHSAPTRWRRADRTCLSAATRIPVLHPALGRSLPAHATSGGQHASPGSHRYRDKNDLAHASLSEISVALAAVAGAALSLIGTCLYLRDIRRGRTTPHRGSWLVWGVISVLAVLSHGAEGGRWSLLVLCGQALATLLVLAFALRCGAGWITVENLMMLGLAAIGVLGWILLADPVAATGFAAVAMAPACWPCCPRPGPTRTRRRLRPTHWPGRPAYSVRSRSRRGTWACCCSRSTSASATRRRPQ